MMARFHENAQVVRLLAYVTGMVNRQLLLQNEYLIAENKILGSHLPARVPLTDPQRATLAEIGKRLGRIVEEPVQLQPLPQLQIKPTGSSLAHVKKNTPVTAQSTSITSFIDA